MPIVTKEQLFQVAEKTGKKPSEVWQTLSAKGYQLQSPQMVENNLSSITAKIQAFPVEKKNTPEGVQEYNALLRERGAMQKGSGITQERASEMYQSNIPKPETFGVKDVGVLGAAAAGFGKAIPFIEGGLISKSEPFKKVSENAVSSLGKSAELYSEGKQTLAETAVQQGAAIAASVPYAAVDTALGAAGEILKIPGYIGDIGAGKDIGSTNEDVARGAQFVVSELAKLPGVIGDIGSGQEIGTTNKGVMNGLIGIQKYFEENPRTAANFKAVNDMVNALLGGGLAMAGKAEKEILKKSLQEAVDASKKVAGATLAAPIKAAGGIVRGAKEGAKFGIAKISGLSRQTVDDILSNPEIVKTLSKENIDREDIFGGVMKDIATQKENLSSTGKIYNEIRKDENIFEVPNVDEIVKSAGIKIQNGELDFSKSRFSAPADINAISKIYDDISKVGTMNAEELLNLRARVDGLINWKSGTNTYAQKIAKEMRSAVDKSAKEKIKGLAALDAKYAPLKKFVGSLEKTIFNADGSIKDNAISKIANLANRGNEQKLALFEKLQPGITQHLKSLRALEDVRLASGNKVGTYAQNILFGGGVLAASGGASVPAAIVMAILSNPVVIKNILLTYATTRNISKKFIQRASDSIFRKIKMGVPLSSQESKIVSSALDGEIKKATAERIQIPEMTRPQTEPLLPQPQFVVPNTRTAERIPVSQIQRAGQERTNIQKETRQGTELPYTQKNLPEGTTTPPATQPNPRSKPVPPKVKNFVIPSPKRYKDGEMLTKKQIDELNTASGDGDYFPEMIKGARKIQLVPKDQVEISLLKDGRDKIVQSKYDFYNKMDYDEIPPAIGVVKNGVVKIANGTHRAQVMIDKGQPVKVVLRDGGEVPKQAIGTQQYSGSDFLKIEYKKLLSKQSDIVSKALDLNKKDTGWRIQKLIDNNTKEQYGTRVINPNTLEFKDFIFDENAPYQDIIKKNSLAQAFAIDNRIMEPAKIHGGEVPKKAVGAVATDVLNESEITDIKKGSPKTETKRKLQYTYESHKEIIDLFHKNKNIEFQKVKAFNSSQLPLSEQIVLHKSQKRSSFGSSPSRYGLIFYKGEPAIYRTSNHWGEFSTNIYDYSKKGKEMIEKGYEADEFGRVGTNSLNWKLIGGDEKSSSPQVGIVLLKDLYNKATSQKPQPPTLPTPKESAKMEELSGTMNQKTDPFFAEAQNAVRDEKKFPVIEKDQYGKNIVYKKNGISISVDEPENAKYFTVWENGKNVGKMLMRANPDAEARGYLDIANIDLKKSIQGQGIGTKLLEIAMDQMPKEIKGISLYLPDVINKRVISIMKKFSPRELGDYLIIDRAKIGNNSQKK